ncbi:MAG TPA: DUF1778 domain-containing protein [Acetobacteraceae bacterium]|nr:DUF1778 domain-containing protein [Acetobacteraceae bacterium]
MAPDRETKAERLEVRLTPATKSLLSQAAQLRHTTLTDFLLSSAVRAAEETLVSSRVFEIGSDEGWSTLMRALDEPADAAPPAALVTLLATDRRSG